jgi:hypothetical protein
MCRCSSGGAFDVIATPEFTREALTVFGAAAVQGVTGLLRNYSGEFLAQGIDRAARHELYVSLLGKSQPFHRRRRIILTSMRSSPTGCFAPTGSFTSPPRPTRSL